MGGGGVAPVHEDPLFIRILLGATTPLLVSQDQITRIPVNFSQQKCYDFFWIDCLDFQDLAGGGGGGRPTTVVPSHFQIRSYGPESGGLMLLKRGF